MHSNDKAKSAILNYVFADYRPAKYAIARQSLVNAIALNSRRTGKAKRAHQPLSCNPCWHAIALNSRRMGKAKRAHHPLPYPHAGTRSPSTPV